MTLCSRDHTYAAMPDRSMSTHVVVVPLRCRRGIRRIRATRPKEDLRRPPQRRPLCKGTQPVWKPDPPDRRRIRGRDILLGRLPLATRGRLRKTTVDHFPTICRERDYPLVVPPGALCNAFFSTNASQDETQDALPVKCRSSGPAGTTARSQRNQD